MDIKNFKILGIAIISVFFVLLIFTANKSHAYTEQLDQEYWPGAGSDGLRMISDAQNFPMYQTFTPNLNRLTKVRLEFISAGPGNDYTIYLAGDNGQNISEATTFVSEGQYYFTFSSPLQVTPGNKYRLVYTHDSTSERAILYNVNTGYDRGEAHCNSGCGGTMDFHFQTYGYNEDSPTPTTTTANPSNSDSDGSSSDSSSTSSNTKKKTTSKSENGDGEDSVQEEDQEESINTLASYEKIETETLDWILYGTLIWAGVSILAVFAFWLAKNKKWRFRR